METNADRFLEVSGSRVPVEKMAMETVDQGKLYKLKLRIVTDDPIYKSLNKLKMRGKDLSHIPREVYFLTELEVLDMSPEREACLYYKLTGVSPYIGQLINLRVLMLDTNEMIELPDEICLLSNLERLSLSNNHFAELPRNFGHLKNLTSLHLSNNEVKLFPSQICELEGLTFLDLCNNYISRLPPQIRNMRNLETLIVFHNNLATIPEEIGDVKKLRTLWIGDNNIKSLPRSIVKLSYLDWGKTYTVSSVVDGNPLITPPVDVCKQGVMAIASFFEAYDRNGASTTRH